MKLRQLFSRLIVALTLLSLMLVAIVALLLGTEAGRKSAIRHAVDLASSPESAITIGEIDAPSLSQLRISDVALRDSGGAWMSIDRLELLWRPQRLFSAVVHVDSLKVDRVDVHRHPVAVEELEKSTESTLSLPIGFELGELGVARLQVHEDIVGVADALSISSSASYVSSSKLNGEITLYRIEEPESRLVADISYDPQPNVLDLSVVLNATPNGILQALVGARPEAPMMLTLQGKGPLTAWNGTFDFAGGDRATATGALQIIQSDEGVRAVSSVRADISDLFSGNVRELLAGTIDIHGEMVDDREGSYRIDQLNISSESLSLAAKGEYDSERDHLASTFDLKAPRGQGFSSLLNMPLDWRDLRVDGEASGSVDLLQIEVNAAVDDLLVENYFIKRLDTSLKPLSDNGSEHRFEGRAQGARLTTSEDGVDANWSIDALLSMQSAPQLEKLDIRIADFIAAFEGKLAADAVKGELTLQSENIATLAPLTGLEMPGFINIKSAIDGVPEIARLRIDLSGEAGGFITGVSKADTLIKQALKLSGKIQTNGGQISFEQVAASNELAKLLLDGDIGKAEDALVVNFSVADIGHIEPRASGELSSLTTLSGTLDALSIDSKISLPDSILFERQVKSAVAHFSGRLEQSMPSGDLVLTAMAEGIPLDGRVKISAANEGAHLDDLKLTFGSASVDGDILLAEQKFPSGQLKISIPRLGDFESLIGVEASGELAADIQLPKTGENVAPKIAIVIKALKLEGVDIASVRIDGEPSLSDAMEWAANVDGEVITASGVTIDKLSGKLEGTPNVIGGNLEFLIGEGRALLDAAVELSDERVQISLRDFQFEQAGQQLKLGEPSTVEIADGVTTIKELVLLSGGGDARIAAVIGEEIALDGTINAFPLGLASLFVPDSALSGSLNGKLHLEGKLDAPQGDYDLSIAGFSMSGLQTSGLAALEVSSKGKIATDLLTVDGKAEGLPGTAVTFAGQIPLTKAASLDMRLRGNASVQEINRLLRIVSADLAGSLSVDISASGALSKPLISGSAKLEKGSFIERINGIQIEDISAEAGINGEVVTLRSFSGRTSNDGTLSASGALDFSQPEAPAIDVTLKANNARILKTQEVIFDLDADIAMVGDLLHQPLINGTVGVRNLDVTLPEQLPPSVSVLGVKHRNAPSNLQQIIDEREQLRRDKKDGAFNAQLDLSINAPGHVFVRGMGVNAEFGGNMRVGGTLLEPIPVGKFELRRGVITIAGRRLDLKRGDFFFIGDLDPQFDVISETRAADITALIGLKGSASAPRVTISSTPEYPEDEVLARLLFGKPSGQLTAGQALAIADAIAGFAGVRSGPGALERLRGSTGLSRLAVGTDEEGRASFEAGGYLSEKAYIGFKQVPSKSTSVTINVDITDRWKATGEVGSDGDSRAGITYEHEY